jgi:hypothetical protein
MDKQLIAEKLRAARPQGVVVANPFDRLLSDVEFLEKALAAIRRRRGLIHGTLKDRHSGRVCALGSMLGDWEGICAPGDLCLKLQRINDSVPKATPEARRTKVIRWLERQIKQRASDSAEPTR